MKNNNKIHGYKVFNPDWTCKGFQFEVGKTFEENVIPKCCEMGFHFCTKLEDCFNYYRFNFNNKVAEIEALGDVDVNDDDSKCCTNKIKIIREITWYEVLDMVNEGKNCTGYCNTGDYNTGDYNTGKCNAGNYNVGNRNTGDFNVGSRNAGDCNTGDYNAGDRNTGDFNTGSYNAGIHNIGDCNTGDRNTGDYNAGDRNTGDFNTGSYNTGDYNVGRCNTGDYNAGDYNTGDFNIGRYNVGCFNTKEKKIMLFDKPSNMTFCEWLNSDAKYLLSKIPKNYVVKWVYKDDMTEKEKEKYPTYKTTGGYLRVLDESGHGQLWWDSLPEHEKEIIRAIPNFDAEIFFQCTGIRVK